MAVAVFMGGSAEEVSGAVGLAASAAVDLAASAAAGLAASAAVDLVVSADSVGASDVSAVVDSDVVRILRWVWWVLLPLLLRMLLLGSGLIADVLIAQAVNWDIPERLAA